MKKLICVLSLVFLFCNNQIANASESNNLISSGVISKYNLQIVEEIPDDIEPLYVENEQELIDLLKELHDMFSDNGTASKSYLDISKNLKETNSIAPLSAPIVNNVTKTHKETIFNLSSIGGKIVSDVNYTYSYWVAPESWITNVNYHDVYETGIWGFQDITYFNKTALPNANGSAINVNVRGISQVYIGLGGSAEGNIILETYHFDKTYTIYPGEGV